MQENQTKLFIRNYLKCSQGNQAQLICSSANCQQNALICNHTSCECSLQKHVNCNLQKIQQLTSKIENYQQSMPVGTENSIEKIINLYDEIIDEISKSKEQFLDSVSLFGLRENTIYFINKISEDQLTDITGELIFKIKEELGKDKISSLLSVQEIQRTWKRVRGQRKLEQLLKCFKDIRISLVDTQLDFISASKEWGNPISYQHGSNKFSTTQWLSQGKSIDQIEKFQLCHKLLSKIPVQLNLLKNLKILSLGNNQIGKIQNISNMSELIQLSLNNNMIQAINNLQNLTKLIKIELQNNQIDKIKGLDNQQLLQHLDLSCNLIEKFENVSHLTNLKNMYVYNNQIQKTQQQLQIATKMNSLHGTLIFFEKDDHNNANNNERVNCNQQ